MRTTTHSAVEAIALLYARHNPHNLPLPTWLVWNGLDTDTDMLDNALEWDFRVDPTVDVDYAEEFGPCTYVYADETEEYDMPGVHHAGDALALTMGDGRHYYGVYLYDLP